MNCDNSFVASRLVDDARANGGVTLTRCFGLSVAGKDSGVYVVGGADHGAEYYLDGRWDDIKVMVYTWLNGLPDSVEYVGSWVDDGKLYVDAVDLVVRDQDTDERMTPLDHGLIAAKALGRARGQKSIYDAKHGEVIWLVDRPEVEPNRVVTFEGSENTPDISRIR